MKKLLGALLLTGVMLSGQHAYGMKQPGITLTQKQAKQIQKLINPKSTVKQAKKLLAKVEEAQKQGQNIKVVAQKHPILKNVTLIVIVVVGAIITVLAAYICKNIKGKTTIEPVNLNQTQAIANQSIANTTQVVIAPKTTFENAQKAREVNAEAFKRFDQEATIAENAIDKLQFDNAQKAQKAQKAREVNAEAFKRFDQEATIAENAKIEAQNAIDKLQFDKTTLSNDAIKCIKDLHHGYTTMLKTAIKDIDACGKELYELCEANKLNESDPSVTEFLDEAQKYYDNLHVAGIGFKKNRDKIFTLKDFKPENK